MSEITIRQSIQKGLAEALDADPNVFIMGEDIGDYGGAYAITSGFLEKYGPERTPVLCSVTTSGNIDCIS